MISEKLYIVNNSLFIEIYVIGYKTIGESIVLFIKCDSNIVFSAVIDCYCYCNVNKTNEILNKNNINNINYLCWTHPDEDHSLGIDLLFEEHVDANTLINIPENAEINAEKCSQRVVEIFNQLKQDVLRKSNKYKVYTVSDSKDLLSCQDDIRFIYNNESFILKMKSIAPNSELLRYDLVNNKLIKNNHSIAFILKLGEILLLFTGDIENPTIESIHKKNIPNHIDFIKVPHHGSNTSNSLLRYFDEASIACATSYIRGNSNHPDINLLNQYCDMCQHVFLTSSKNKEDNQNNFGIIHINFDVLNNSINAVTEGNAIEYKRC